MTAAHDRTDAIAAFYRAHRAALERIVAHRVSGTDRFLIEDACQFAWTVLLRRPDIRLDDDGLAWLATVATREGWQAARRRDLPCGTYTATAREEATDAPAPCLRPPVEEQVIDREDHRTRVAALERLKPAERQALVLKAAGYSYRDIGEITAASYTAVNRRLSEGRAALRRLDTSRA